MLTDSKISGSKYCGEAIAKEQMGDEKKTSRTEEKKTHTAKNRQDILPKMGNPRSHTTIKYAKEVN